MILREKNFTFFVIQSGKTGQGTINDRNSTKDSVILQQHVKIDFFPIHLLGYFCDTTMEQKIFEFFFFNKK